MLNTHKPHEQAATLARPAARQRLAMLGLACAMGLAACGGGDSDSPAPVPPAPAPAPAPAPNPPPAPPPAPQPPPLADQPVAPRFDVNAVLRDTHRVDGSLIGVPLRDVAPVYRVAGDLPNIDMVWRFYGVNGGDRDWQDSPPIRLQGDGSVVYLDRVGMQVVRVTLDGQVRRQASPGRDAQGAAQGFWRPTAFATDALGHAFVADGWYQLAEVCFPIGPCGPSVNPLADGARAGIWRVDAQGSITRVTGVVAGDAQTDGAMVDGPRDVAQFSAIVQMELDEQGRIVVLDSQRVKRSNGTSWPPQQMVLRRVAQDGSVSTLRALNGRAWLRRDGNKQLKLLVQTSNDYPLVHSVQDIDSGAEASVHGSTRAAWLDPNQAHWQRNIDAEGNTWRWDTFRMYPTYEGLDLFAVTRYGPDSFYRPGSVLLHMAAQPDLRLLGVSDAQQLVGLINGQLMRVDLAGVPKP